MVLLADTTDTFRPVMCCFDVSSASKLQHLASSTRQKHKQSNLFRIQSIFINIFKFKSFKQFEIYGTHIMSVQSGTQSVC